MFFTVQQQHNIKEIGPSPLFATFKLQLLTSNLLHHVMCMLHPGQPPSIAMKGLDILNALTFTRDDEFPLISQLIEQDGIFTQFAKRTSVQDQLCDRPQLDFAVAHLEFTKTYLLKKKGECMIEVASNLNIITSVTNWIAQVKLAVNRKASSTADILRLR